MENYVKLTSDEKAVLLKTIAEMYSAASTLHSLIKEDELTEEMKSILPSLLEAFFKDISIKLDYESTITKEREERYVLLREANTTIDELRKQLGSQNPVDGLKEHLTLLHDKVSDWWDDYGFHYVANPKFSSNGNYFAEFSFMLEMRSLSHSQTPISDKTENETHLQNLRDKGFQFADGLGRGNEFYLIDNDTNRKLLLEMLRERFPSLQVHSWKNQKVGKNDDYIIRYVDFAIYNLTDI